MTAKEERARQASEYTEHILSRQRTWIVVPGFEPEPSVRDELNVAAKTWGAVPGYSASESAVVVLYAPIGPSLITRTMVRISWLLTPAYTLADAFHGRHCALVWDAPSSMLSQSRVISHAEIVEKALEYFRWAFRSRMRQALIGGPPQLTSKLLEHSAAFMTFGRTTFGSRPRSKMHVVTDPITHTYWVVCSESPSMGAPATFDGYTDQELAIRTAEQLAQCGDELEQKFRMARGPLFEALVQTKLVPAPDPMQLPTFGEVSSHIQQNPAALYLAGDAFGPEVPAGYRVFRKADSWDWEKSGAVSVQVPAEVYEALAWAIRFNRAPRHADNQEER
jgi:hypothetical protein